MTYGLLHDAKILTSFKAFCFSLSDRFSNLTFFKAYISPSTKRLALCTTLYAPSPIEFGKN